MKEKLLLMVEELDQIHQSLCSDEPAGVDYYMTRAEAATFLGITERTLDRRTACGDIVKEYVDGRIRFRRSELLKYNGYILDENGKAQKGSASESELDKLLDRFPKKNKTNKR